MDAHVGVSQGGDMGKAPAFQFYAADFLTGTSEMTSFEIGVYIRLLAFSWDKGALPADRTRLARMVGEPVDAFEAAWEIVGQKWTLTEDGYINDRLEQQRAERAEFAARQAARGRRSGDIRRTRSERGRSVPVEPEGEPEANQGPLNSSVFDLQSSRESKEHSLLAAELVDAWNSGTSSPIPKCRGISPGRKKHIHARLKDAPLDEWVQVIARINASDFCRGQSERGWVATFDWLLQPETRLKVLEGKYDNRGSQAKSTDREGLHGDMMDAEATRRFLAEAAAAQDARRQAS